MKKLIVFAFLISSLNSFAAILCPSSIQCAGNTLSTCSFQGTDFKFSPDMNPDMSVDKGMIRLQDALGSIPANAATPATCRYVQISDRLIMIKLISVNPNAIPVNSSKCSRWVSIDNINYSCYSSHIPSICPFTV